MMQHLTKHAGALALGAALAAAGAGTVRTLAAPAHAALRGAASATGTTGTGAGTTAAGAARGYTLATAPYAFSFPRDHAAHDGYQTEWWYYTGHLRAADGRRFGYELTFFRAAMRPGDPPIPHGESRWRGHELYPAHFAITDERGKTFFYVDRFAREALGMGSAATDRLAVKDLDWHLAGAPAGRSDIERMTMHAGEATAQGENALDLVQLPLKPPAINGTGGVSRKGACASCASHYYSYTRLHTTGSMTFHGARLAVDGVSWMDHEYGSSELQSGEAGWDWFSLQLDDGRELMLYRLRRRDGGVVPESSGTLVARDGATTHLPLAAFATAATGSWKSPHTGGTYPMGWTVDVPSAKLAVTLTPVLDDQELATASGGVSYWEGAVDVADAAGKHAGLGYVEMTGYAGALNF